MHRVFNIDAGLVKELDDEMARELVARLCRAELRAQGLPESAVTWGGDQRAKDGGVDVRVDCSCPLPSSDFVKHPNTVFQVKAETFPPSKIQNEMAPKGVLRAAIRGLGEKGGAYIIVSSKDLVSDTALASRRSAMSQCLTEHGLGSSVQTDFYGSRRIADWVEQHPSIGSWLRHKTGRLIRGWQPYGAWAYRESDPEAEYLVDDLAKVFLPDTQVKVSATEAITRLRGELKQPVAIRIVGLSGVGKTRLVQAIFDPRVCPENPAPIPENVIYTDLADEPEPQPRAMLEDLQARGSDSVVVVDNCGSDTHERLTELLEKEGCRLRLITIEFDIRDDLPEGTLCYRLEGSAPEIIKQLVKGRFPSVSDNDAGRIADFSDGNARVALALASTVKNGGELSRLRNEQLFERLFHQRNAPNNELLRCAETASLLYSFDGSDAAASGEMARLASLAEVTPLTFSRCMAEMERRGLLQKRGQWRAVLPHAIANGLAGRMLQSVPGSLLASELIDNGGERVGRSFTRRLGYLHDCSEAVEMAAQMLCDGGRLGDLTALTDFEKEMFGNLASLDQRGALDAVKRAIEKNALLSSADERLGRLAEVVRLIAYGPEFFGDAVMILRRFALAQPRDSQGQARDALKSLFSCYLSGTQAIPKQRHEVVRKLLSSKDENERELGLDLAEVGLQAGHFISFYGNEFGARHRDHGWCPRNVADLRSWYTPWVEMLAASGEQDNEDGRRARIALADAWPHLWGRVGTDEELAHAAKCFKTIDGWPEGWLAVRRTLRRADESPSPESRAQLIEIEKALAPADLASEIRARVLARGARDDALEEDGEPRGEDADPPSPRARSLAALTKLQALGAKAAHPLSCWRL